MRLLLWDCDDRSYTFDVSVSNDRKNWKLIVRRDELSRSWQYMEFEVKFCFLNFNIELNYNLQTLLNFYFLVSNRRLLSNCWNA